MSAASASFARPPAGLPLDELFTVWLPSAFAQAQAAGAAPPDLRISVTLDGDGGGAWTLAVSGKNLTVTSGAERNAPIALHQTAADFRAALWGEGGTDALVPPQLDLTAAITGQSKLPLDALANVRGVLRAEIPGFAGRTWAATFTFAGAPSPTATVSVDTATLDELRRGTLPPAQAFFAGRIAISGDVAWLMQVGMNLAAGGLR